MKRVAILLSGNMRNILDTLDNLQVNLINPIIANDLKYDIFIHTWDSNIIGDTVHSRDKFVKTNDISFIIKSLKDKFNIKNVIIENQESIYNLHGGDSMINKIIGNREVRKEGREYTFGLVKKHYFQYYGQYKSFTTIQGDYDYIIKTRPDVWYYEKFNVNLLNDLMFPNSHQFNGKNINQIFYAGPYQPIKEILYFWKLIKTDLDILLKDYFNKKDINLNLIFRHYIENILNLTPKFVDYNIGLYRTDNLITEMHK